MLKPSRPKVGTAGAFAHAIEDPAKKFFSRNFSTTLAPLPHSLTPDHLVSGTSARREIGGTEVHRGPPELIWQVGDPPVPIFNYLVDSCMSSACSFSVSRGIASYSEYVL